MRQFSSMRLLREIRALTQWYEPSRIRVEAVQGTSTDWNRLEGADVVVAIPQSISPVSAAEVSVPPHDMFDLVIVDEAHHLPSATWNGVIELLSFRNALFLTATPFRLDRKPVPGTRTFYFPMRQAIADSFFKPIRPLVLPRPDSNDLSARDDVIAAEIVRLMSSEEHSTSALLVRAQNVDRANDLADRYRQSGIDIEVLTSHLSEVSQVNIVRRLISGELRAVSVVGMLGEGFDLPRLRLVAYHDKHKSVPATVQMIGRLARVSETFPQESVLVTVDDADVYPELQGVVRTLYNEDADWAQILPGLVDAKIAAEAANAAFVEALPEREGEVDPANLMPMPRPVVYEIEHPAWHPLGAAGGLPDDLHVGGTIAGARILMAAAANDGSLVALVTRRKGVPPWSGDLTLESVEYGLSLISFRPSPRTDLPGLLFVDASDTRIALALLQAMSVPECQLEVSPERLDGYLQSLPRISVSSIGMRNILAGTRGTSYKTRAGTSTDTDLLSTETTQTSLGHVMMQIRTATGSTTVGAAFEKGKIWQRRYKPLIDYSEWVSEAAELLWFPRAGSGDRLLPQISRGRSFSSWPIEPPIAVEPNPATVIGGYQLFRDTTFLCNLEDFELFVGVDPTGSHDLPERTDSVLSIGGLMNDRSDQEALVVWAGSFSINGQVSAQGSDLHVKRGYSDVGPLSEFLEHYPPLIYFLNGQASQGREMFDVQGGSTSQCDPRNILEHDWLSSGVDIKAETRNRSIFNGAGISIHEELERYLLAQPKAERWRWILCNDGTGEIADYVVIEWTARRPVRLSLWHAKGTRGEPGLRVEDFQVVVAQAMRSRSRYNDPDLWVELRKRIQGQSSPRATLVDGSDRLARLLVLLGSARSNGGERSYTWMLKRPLVHGEIAVVQPGLSRSQLLAHPPDTSGTTANSLHQLFGILADTIAVTGNRAIVPGSP